MSPDDRLFLDRRPRRLRQSAAVRGLVRETSLTARRLVLPLFLVDGEGRSEPIEALPGHARQSADGLAALVERALAVGVRSFALFPAIDPALKSADAADALRSDNVLCRAVRALRRRYPEIVLITDLALDPYSSLGHDGLIDARGRVANDETVAVLARMAALHAECGANVVAPSDMMDGRVGAVRAALDDAGFTDTAVLAYTAKYASAFYGPFRQALASAPVAAPNVPSDKTTYQMDPANSREASVEAALDEGEGADILMVKPALPYLDVISQLRAETALPIAAYQVSGEYAMLRAAHDRGWLDYRAAMSEALISIARAGADVIVTYAALDYAEWVRAGLVEP